MAVTDVAVHESEELQLPHSAQLVDLSDANACVKALQEVRSIEARLRETKQILSAAIIAESQKQGTKTMYLAGAKVEVRGGTVTQWDAEALEQGLRAAGLPEERIREVVKETVSYAVSAREARRVARANPEYAAVVDSAQTVIEATPSVVVSKGQLEGAR